MDLRVPCIMPGNSTNPAGVEAVENLSSEIRSALGRLLIPIFNKQ